MKQKGHGTVVKVGVAALALLVFGIVGIAVVGGVGGETTETKTEATQPAVTANDIAKVVAEAMEKKEVIETRRKTEFPVMAPENEYTDVMARLNEFGKKVNEKLEGSESTDVRLVEAIEKLTARLSELESKAKANDAQIMQAVDQVTARVALMGKKEGETRDEALAAAINSLSTKLDKPSPKAAPAPKDERVDSLAERLARMEARMSEPSPKPVVRISGGSFRSVSEVNDLRPSWNRPVETRRVATIEDLRRAGDEAEDDENDMGLIRSAISSAAEGVEGGTDILSGGIKGATDVASGTVKDLTRTAGKTIGGASKVTGDTVGGTANLASEQGKRVWKKIW